MAAVPNRRILSVSQVNRLVAGMLSEYFSDIWVVGEISNLKFYPSGHIYLSLNDEESQLAAVCFRDSAKKLRFKLEDGLLVIAHGRLEVYVPNGKYQIVLDVIEPKGLGTLQQAFEQLKRKLQREGLFDEARKRPLPRLPKVVGIVTSPAGAAIHDMIKTLRLHKAHLTVLFYPVAVQGDGAAEQIAEAIQELNRRSDVEVIIIGRGGGSFEDLWPFNEEVVARAIASSRVPVVTGIGHEVDFTIADFVADYRAATPTAAAQTVARGWQELADRFRQLAEKMFTFMQEWLFDYEQRIEELSGHRGFELVSRRVSEIGYQVRVWEGMLTGTFLTLFRTLNERLNSSFFRLNRQNPVTRVKSAAIRLSEFNVRMERVISTAKNHWHTQLGALTAGLQALSPLASLARGYAICLKPDGSLVKSTDQVKIGEAVVVRVVDGRLVCEVNERIKGG